MNLTQRLTLINTMVVLALMLGLLSGCGKKGSPVAPGPDSDLTYPRIYPTH